MTVITRSPGSFTLPSTPVPTTSSQVANYDSEVAGMWVLNSSASPITFSATDGNGTAIIPAFAVVPNSRVALVESVCETFCPGGFSVAASATGLYFGASWTS